MTVITTIYMPQISLFQINAACFNYRITVYASFGQFVLAPEGIAALTAILSYAHVTGVKCPGYSHTYRPLNHLKLSMQSTYVPLCPLSPKAGTVGACTAPHVHMFENVSLNYAEDIFD
jgi:hypothetical protein